MHHYNVIASLIEDYTYWPTVCLVLMQCQPSMYPLDKYPYYWL